MNILEIQKQRDELFDIQKDIEEKLSRLNLLEKEMNESDREIKVIADSIDKSLKNFIEKDKFIKFFEKPYVLIPQGKNKVLVAVPKFIKNFQVGWLWKEEESFFIYQLDQYSSWLGDVPKEILEQINFKQEFKAEVIENQIFFEPEFKEIIKKQLGKHLTNFNQNSARIVKGHEFDLIADMIEKGNLPFKPKKVLKEDLREGKSSYQLREYQKLAFDRFLETGAIGLFHPTGAGKSMVAMKGIDVLKGKKLIIVPTKTLSQQWSYYIEKYIPHCRNEIVISTYQGYRNDRTEHTLVIFDECHKLPADTFSRLALIKTKYRMGLSASPHREDNREPYIFALTGFPVGLNWQDYMRTVGKSYHPIFVHKVRNDSNKISKVLELINNKKKTLIFCDSIELGKKISNELNVPFIFGETENRIELIERNKVMVCSRVLDLGVESCEARKIARLSRVIVNPSQQPSKIIKYVQFRDVEKNLGEITNFTELAGYEAPSRAKQMVNEGDIICARVKDSEENVARIPTELNNEIVSTGFVVLKPLEPMTSEALFALLRLRTTLNQVRWKSSGTIMPSISDDEYLSIKVPKLTKNEIERVTKEIKEINKQRESIKEKLNRLSEKVK